MLPLISFSSFYSSTMPLALWANPERPVRMADEEIFLKRPWKQLQVFIVTTKYLSDSSIISSMKDVYDPLKVSFIFETWWLRGNCHSNARTRKRGPIPVWLLLLWWFFSRLVGRRWWWARCLNRVYLPFLKSSKFFVEVALEIQLRGTNGAWLVGWSNCSNSFRKNASPLAKPSGSRSSSFY